MNKYEVLDFLVRGDSTGSLVAIEGDKNIPFGIKRVYYIYGTEAGVVRGRHSHKILQQLIFCPIGSCDFILDNGTSRETIRLQRPNQGIYIKGNIWREFTNFSADCVVMVLASEHYDESDYIRDYQAFLNSVGGGI